MTRRSRPARICSRPRTWRTWCASAASSRERNDVIQVDPPQAYGIVQYARTLDMLARHGWPRRLLFPHGGNQMSLAIAAGFGLGGAESYPGVFGDFGGFADDAELSDGYLHAVAIVPASASKARRGSTASCGNWPPSNCPSRGGIRRHLSAARSFVGGERAGMQRDAAEFERARAVRPQRLEQRRTRQTTRSIAAARRAPRKSRTSTSPSLLSSATRAWVTSTLTTAACATSASRPRIAPLRITVRR